MPHFSSLDWAGRRFAQPRQALADRRTPRLLALTSHHNQVPRPPAGWPSSAENAPIM
jgi:hypothetical protein